MEDLLRRVAGSVALGLEAFSVLAIAWGGLQAAYQVFVPTIIGRSTAGYRRVAWVNFGRWLLIGLEFTLAADIVRTVISPTWKDVGLLGAIAAIRTFLNYFLERDLQAASRESAPAPTKAPVRVAHES